MGFGMRKEFYTQKPRNFFSKLKKILDVEVTHHQPLHKIDQHQLSEQEKIEIKKKIENEKQKEFRKNIIVGIISLFILSLVILQLIKILKNVL